MQNFDQIWSRVVKIFAFFLGMYIMYHEAFQDNLDRPYLLAAAVAMMGLQVAETVEKIVAGFGSGRKSLPSEPLPPLDKSLPPSEQEGLSTTNETNPT
jgi:hypothetical protein